MWCTLQQVFDKMVLLSVNVCHHLFEDPDSQYGSELDNLFQIHAKNMSKTGENARSVLKEISVFGWSPHLF